LPGTSIDPTAGSLLPKSAQEKVTGISATSRTVPNWSPARTVVARHVDPSYAVF